jgi:hypothetical protein
MRRGLSRVVPFAIAVSAAAACTRNPYVIGTICPPAGADAGASSDPRCASAPANATLAVDLDRSGASALGALALASGELAPALRLRGERATVDAWPSEGGPVLGAGAGAATPGLGAPFTDGTRAVRLSADAPSYVAADASVGAVGSDDFALEVVLRAASGASFLDKHTGAAGWWLHQAASGELQLDVGDGDPTHAVSIASRPLTPGAWYHCLFWVSHASAQGLVDCDGADLAPVPLPATLGALDGPGSLAVGGGGAAQLADAALFRAARGALGDVASWMDASQRRFAALTGVYPSIAGGKRVPNAGLRDGEAYLDMQSEVGGPRRLFLVGTEWPRVACRPDANGTRVCGYFGEPARSRAVPAAASAWLAGGLAVAMGPTAFVDGDARFSALTAAAASGTHTLSATATTGQAPQVLSFYAHSLGAAVVGASAGGSGVAVFDVQAGRVVTQPADVAATIEPWGDGIFRCAYRFKSAGGPTTYTVHMLDDAGGDTFVGSGAPTLEVAGLQVDVNLAHPGSLLAAPTQAPDKLAFAGNPGNLPASGPVLAVVDVVLAAGPIVRDQAIFNINFMSAFGGQVQLYLRGDNDQLKFWALDGQSNAAFWAFSSDKALIANGARHSLVAGWDASSARLVIDRDQPLSAPVQGTPPATLDEIDLGVSEKSAGAFEGLISGFRIGAP